MTDEEFDYNIRAIRFTVEGFGIMQGVSSPLDYTAKEAVHKYPKHFHDLFMDSCQRLYDLYISRLAKGEGNND